MTALLLGLLLVAPPPESDESYVVRPPVPVPEAGFPRVTRDTRSAEWGFTAAVGIGAVTDRASPGVVLWGGVRRWLAPNVIAGGLVTFQQFDRVSIVGALARFELATRTDRDRLFPTFSVYLGAGPELFSSTAGTSAGVKLVVGVHLPTLWTSLVDDRPFPFRLAGWELLLLLPLALEAQFRTGGGSVPSSTAVVVAIAL
jgi:hypothetical protein